MPAIAHPIDEIPYSQIFLFSPTTLGHKVHRVAADVLWVEKVLHHPRGYVEKCCGFTGNSSAAQQPNRQSRAGGTRLSQMLRKQSGLLS